MSTITIPLRPSAAARVLPLAAAGALAVTAVVVLGTPGHSAPALPEPAAVPAVAGPPVVPNAGQSPAAVRFEARAEGGALYFTPRDVVLARRAAVVRLRFDGAAAAPRVTPTGRRAGVVNVLRGPDPARWRTGLSSYAGVRYAGLYPGVDVRHDVAATAAGPWVRSVFTVASGADATAISWRYAGAHRPSVDPVTGALEVAPRAGGPALRSSAPIAWQVVGGRREAVPASFRVDDDGAVGFALGRHDRAHPLLLAAVPPTRKAANDPQPQLTFSSFFGGTNWDELYDVDVDPAGDAYVTGITNSPNFPLANARQGQFADVIDAVVARVSAAGTLVYSTYLGGDAMDAGHNIAVDKGGNAYVTGRTESEDFPVEAPLQRPINGRRCQGEPCHDAFVTKLDPNGQIAYSTYLGGTGTEEGWGIAVDGDGRAVVTGNTDSDDFPTRNAVQDTNRSKTRSRLVHSHDPRRQGSELREHHGKRRESLAVALSSVAAVDPSTCRALALIELHWYAGSRAAARRATGSRLPLCCPRGADRGANECPESRKPPLGGGFRAGHGSPLNYYVPGLVSIAWAA